MNIQDFGRKSFIVHTTGLIERVKRMTNEEHLKVLDMSEDEQWEWCVKNVKSAGESLADLAFRLRDEAMAENSDNWALACWYVQQWIGLHKIETYESPSLDGLLNADHEILSKSPIHWIIAALIAKESK